MPGSYRHISDDTEEIIRLKEEGFTGREICEKFGFTGKQYKDFITRHNRKQEKTAAGIAIKKKGRPQKDYQVGEEDRVAQLRCIIDRKDAGIKSLETENELMRGLLSLTGQ